MNLLDHPIMLFLLSILLLSVSVWVGLNLRGHKELEGETRENFGVVLAASLTLLGLIIGFSFSMATSRYDQRKNYEEAEANAIGTELVRAELLPAAESPAVKKVLAAYLDERVRWYEERDPRELRQIDQKIAQLQSEMWSAVKVRAAQGPDPVVALVVAGMNDVLNSQGYTQAAWWNRIPAAAWALMFAIAVLCNGMMGYASSIRHPRYFVIMILPVIVSISFYLIADIDSPRGGMIRVIPQNLLSLVGSLPQ
jgi:hypothetical protein